MLDITTLSDKFIIAHDKLFGTRGTEYFTIFFINFLSYSFIDIYLYNFKFINTYNEVTILANTLDKINPYTPYRKTAINITFNII